VGDAIAVTPHRAASEHLGVPHVSLRSIAERMLRQENIGVASHLTALHSLKAAINRTDPKLDPAAEAARVRQILGTVLRAGIDLNSLREHGSTRANFLANIAEIYVSSLAERNMIDREAVLWRASQLEFPKEKLFIYGYFRARKEEVLFIDKIAADESIFFLPCHENSIFEANRVWAAKLNALGWVIDATDDLTPNDVCPVTEMALRFINETYEGGRHQEASSTRNEIASDPSAIAYPNIEDEVRGTLARAKHLIIKNGVRPEKIAIVCRTVQPYAPLIASVSREYALPVEMQHMIPLAQSAVGNFVKLLLESAGPDSETGEKIDPPFGFETTARMLLHALGPGIEDDKWPEARKFHPSSLDEWQDLGTDLSILRVADTQPYVDWTVWLGSVLKKFKVRDKAGAGATELTAFNRLFDAIDEQTRYQGQRMVAYNGFASDVFDILSTVTTPFDTSSGGVVLHQPNTVIGGEFDHVFVLGMAEGMLPAKVTENPIIDFHERKRLDAFGIEFEDASEVPRWEALSFYFVLLAGAKSLTFSYPRYVDGDARLPNSYFKKLGLSPGEARTEFVSSSEELRRVCLVGAESPVADEVLGRAKYQFTVEELRESPAPFDEFDGVVSSGLDPTKRKWSVSQLTKIGQCPFKWFSEKVLYLGVPEEADVDLPATTKGSLYHKTLEIAVRNAMTADDIRSAVLENLDVAFLEAESSDDYSITKVANWELQRHEHLEALRKAVRSSSFIADGARVLAVEQEFETVWMDLPIGGRIDRIDESPEGLTTIDYKTGSYTGKVKDESGRLKIDLQVPVYSQVALPHLYPGKPIGPGIYLRLAKREAEEGKNVPLEAFVANVKETMSSGRFLVEPDIDGAACKYCDFDSVCRQGPRLELKRSE
jgi:ATP-dependent helicase/DNAse subunit B